MGETSITIWKSWFGLLFLVVVKLHLHPFPPQTSLVYNWNVLWSIHFRAPKQQGPGAPAGKWSTGPKALWTWRGPAVASPTPDARGEGPIDMFYIDRINPQKKKIWDDPSKLVFLFTSYFFVRRLSFQAVALHIYIYTYCICIYIYRNWYMLLCTLHLDSVSCPRDLKLRGRSSVWHAEVEAQRALGEPSETRWELIPWGWKHHRQLGWINKCGRGNENLDAVDT